MNTLGLFNKMRKARIVAVFLAMLLAYGAISLSPRADAPLKTYSVDIGGVTGATNNTVLAFGRYVLVAPFAPSKGVSENGELDLEQLDNYSIYVIDTKKPNVPPLQKNLTAWDPLLQTTRKVYFPTRLVFDPASSTLFVRGTRYEAIADDLFAIDVVAYVHVNLDAESGKPAFDAGVVFDIGGVTGKYTSDAPSNFGLGWKGNLLVYTNGATVFSFNVTTGEVNRAEIVPASLYGKDNSISFLGVDPITNIVSVSWTTKTVDKDDVAKFSSEVSLYQLEEKGTFNLLKRVYPDQFPDATALASGSNIAILADPDKQTPELALFATDDGSLCQVDLGSDEVRTTAKRLYTFPELGRSGKGDPDPITVQYDSSTRVVRVVRSGFTVQIGRPSNGKRGRIGRPSNVHILSSGPVLAMAKLGKKNKVSSVIAFSDEFTDEGGISNVVSGQDSQWLVSTYSGKLYSVAVGGDVKDSRLQFVGAIGSRVDHIDYYDARSSVVAINAFTLDESGMRVATPGSLVIGRMSDLQAQSSGVAILQALVPSASMLGKSAPSIRRPCNIRR